MIKTIPYAQPKALGFDIFPPGTHKTHDGGKWALYYCPSMDMSFIVIDFGGYWKINHYLGKMQIRYASSVMSMQPCCQD